jgi:hypothetical protein
MGWEVSVATFPDEAGTLLRLIHNENSYDGIVIGDTSWHHLALATDGSTTTLWVDGYAAAQSAAGFSINDRILQLGNSSASARTIEMDEVQLSNVVRYSTGFIPSAITNDENTLGYWRFNVLLTRIFQLFTIFPVADCTWASMGTARQHGTRMRL